MVTARFRVADAIGPWSKLPESFLSKPRSEWAVVAEDLQRLDLLPVAVRGSQETNGSYRGGFTDCANRNLATTSCEGIRTV
jgi:hypothetical protein